MIIKYKKLRPTALVPVYAKPGDSGADLFADIDQPIIILPGKSAIIETNICFQIPECYEGQIRPKSGMAFIHDIEVSWGTDDSSFRGAIKVKLRNFGEREYVVNYGDKVAQIVFAGVIHADFIKGDLDETERGINGFGSTGYKYDNAEISKLMSALAGLSTDKTNEILNAIQEVKTDEAQHVYDNLQKLSEKPTYTVYNETGTVIQ
jgi:dUTP pyrophosphatase